MEREVGVVEKSGQLQIKSLAFTSHRGLNYNVTQQTSDGKCACAFDSGG